MSACSELKPVTVHSFIGVETGQAPFDVLVSRALTCNNPLVKRRLQEVDYLPRLHHVVVFIPLQIPAYKNFAHIPAFNSCKQCALVVFLEEDGPRLVKYFLFKFIICHSSIFAVFGSILEYFMRSLDKSFGIPNFTEFIDVCKLL